VEATSHGAGVTAVTAETTMRGMHQSPDQPPPSPKPKLSAEERQVREVDRLKTTRLRVLIDQELDDRGVTDPVEIGAALGMPAAEANKLLTRSQWREGDVALLEAAAARLGGEGAEDVLAAGSVPMSDSVPRSCPYSPGFGARTGLAGWLEGEDFGSGPLVDFRSLEAT
jgi:hypothetical protein